MYLLIHMHAAAAGGFCNVSGECICHEGFTGENCDINVAGVCMHIKHACSDIM